MRLIDADRIKDKLKYSMHVRMGYLNYCNEVGRDLGEKEKYFEEFIDWHKDMIRMIDDAPTVKSESEQTGRWIQDKWIVYCSECKKSFDAVYKYDFAYCPNCGAKMQ